jgi:hypothetical protein
MTSENAGQAAQSLRDAIENFRRSKKGSNIIRYVPREPPAEVTERWNSLEAIGYSLYLIEKAEANPDAAPMLLSMAGGILWKESVLSRDAVESLLCAG